MLEVYQARIQDFCQERAPKHWWPYMGWRSVIFDIPMQIQICNFSNMFLAILCLNGVEQPFKAHQSPFFLPLRRRNPRLRRVPSVPGVDAGPHAPRGSAPVYRVRCHTCMYRGLCWKLFSFSFSPRNGLAFDLILGGKIALCGLLGPTMDSPTDMSDVKQKI